MSTRTIISAALIATILGMAIIPSLKPCQPAFALPLVPDLVYDPAPSVKLGNRTLDLSIKYGSPFLIVYNDSITTSSYGLRLFDESTNQTIKHVTYYVELTKIGNAKSSLSDVFHSHNGPLTLKVNLHNNNDSKQLPTINGEHDPFYNAWLTDFSNTVVIDANTAALDAGLYHFHVEIIGIDSDKSVFPDEMPKFDYYLGLAGALSKQIHFLDHSYNVTVISYTDKINSFEFDNGQFAWSIPFNWDAEYLNSTYDSIFVHQEIKVPNSFPGMNSSDYTEIEKANATVNGIPLNHRNFIADPYTFQDYTVFHYVLNKNDMIKMAGQLQNQSSSAEATFTLASSTTVPEFSPVYVLAAAVAIIIVSMNMAARKRV